MVIGVASPTSIREAWGSLDIKMETGILMQKAEDTPWIITGMLWPRPLKYPMLLNRMPRLIPKVRMSRKDCPKPIAIFQRQ